MVGTAQPLCLSRQEKPKGVVTYTKSLEKRQITAPHYILGLDDETSSSRRGSVFLDIPFYRTALSVLTQRKGSSIRAQTRRNNENRSFRSVVWQPQDLIQAEGCAPKTILSPGQRQDNGPQRLQCEAAIQWYAVR